MKQFDGDYDILYRMIKDKSLAPSNNLKSTSSLTVKAFLQKNYDNSDQTGTKLKSKKVTAESNSSQQSELEDLTENFENLEISVPVHAEEWNTNSYTPLVAIIPLGKDLENLNHIKAYKPNGEKVQLKADETPDKPVICVSGISERVDKNGMMAVSKQGIVIPEEKRKITAREVYNKAKNSKLKSSSSKSDKLINIHKKLPELNNKNKSISPSDSVIDKFKKKKKKNIQKKVTLKNAVSKLKSTEENNETTEVPTPENVKIHYVSTNNKVELDWDPVNGADKYRFYYRVVSPNTGSSYKAWNYETREMVTVECDLNKYHYCTSQNSYYVHACLWVHMWGDPYWLKLPSKWKIRYRIMAVKDGNTSSISDPVEQWVSPRNPGYTEQITSVDVNQEALNSIEYGWWSGKVELNFKVKANDVTKNVGYGKVSRGSIKDWAPHDANLFEYYPSTAGNKYAVQVYEHDADNSNQQEMTINFGLKIPVKDVSGWLSDYVNANIDYTYHIDDVNEECGIFYPRWRHKLNNIYGTTPIGGGTIRYKLTQVK